LDRDPGWFGWCRRPFRCGDRRRIDEILETGWRENKQVTIFRSTGIFKLVRDIPRRKQGVARSQQKALIAHLDLQFAGQDVIRLVLPCVGVARDPDAGRKRYVKQAQKISAEELHRGIGHRPHCRALPSGLSYHPHPLQQAQD